MQKYDVVVIGAGIVGTSIARVLSQYENFKVLLVERNPDVGWGASKANTSVIHPGHEEEPDKHPLRARLCVEGNRIWHEWVEELDIPARWPGELMLASNEDEIGVQRRYLELAERNDVPGVRLVLDRDELQALDQSISPKVIAGLYAPTAGLINPMEAVIAIVENAVENGVKLLVNTEVKEVRVVAGRVEGVETSRGFIKADLVINAAGIYADRISRGAGVEDFSIRPRRGEYWVFDENVALKPSRILHSTPTHVTKGVYAITTVEGNLLIGPTAEDLGPEDREETSTTIRGLSYVWNEASRLLRALPSRTKVIRTFAGLRPEPVGTGGEWVIEACDSPWGFVNVAGMRSPGLTAAPAIAKYVLGLIDEKFHVKLVRRRTWNPNRTGMKRIRSMPRKELNGLIEERPSYGRIICMCKVVSEGEVLEAIKRIRKIGAEVTLDGVKFRTYAMVGFCQGSFCRARVVWLISESLGINMWEVNSREEGTSYGIGDVKLLRRDKVVEQ